MVSMMSLSGASSELKQLRGEFCNSPPKLTVVAVHSKPKFSPNWKPVVTILLCYTQEART